MHLTSLVMHEIVDVMHDIGNVTQPQHQLDSHSIKHSVKKQKKLPVFLLKRDSALCAV
jgi:hypothetical protein